MRQIGECLRLVSREIHAFAGVVPVVREVFVRLYEEGLIYREN